MPDQSSPALRGRPFPWHCTRCRRKEVVRAVIPYECQRIYQGRPITVVIAELTVPRCAHCGELEFNYDAEAQINQAYQAQTEALRSPTTPPASPQPVVEVQNSPR